MSPSILRGDVYFADLDPTIGSEQGGMRPVLVVQNDVGNRHSPTVIVAAITNRRKPALPTHVRLPWAAGLDAGSTVLLEQVRTIDKSRLAQKVCAIGGEQMRFIDLALMASLGIRNNRPDAMVMTLCRSCVQAFRESGGYFVRRADFRQEEREPCTMCNVRTGYDYEVMRA